MFSSIKRKLQGIPTEFVLKKKSKEIFDRLSKDPNKIASSIISNNLRESWENWHNDSISDIGKANNRYEQMIGLRKAIIEQIEVLSCSTPLVTDKYSDDDKKILVEALDEDQEYETAMSAHLFRYMYAQTSWQVFRYISHDFDDASPHDWNECYKHINDIYVEQTYKQMINKIKGKKDVLVDELVNSIKSKRDEIRQEILKGSNYEYNIEEIEKEQQQEKEKREQEEREQNQKEEAKRISTKSITSSKIQDLTEFIIERYECIKNGELYNIKGFLPVNVYNALAVDSGIMLIALSECVADIEIAKDGLRKVLWNFSESIGNENNFYGKTHEDVNIETAQIIFNRKKENEEGGWLSDLVLIATLLLYDIVLSDFTEEEQRAIARSSAEIIDDTWSAYANTKNVFGYGLNTEGMFS